MIIIDNFGLPSRRGASDSDWLERIIDAVRLASDGNAVVRLRAERSGTSLVYMLVNNHNKTRVSLIKHYGRIHIALQERELPDPEKGFRPNMVTVQEHQFLTEPVGLIAAAEMIQKHLDKDTPYSLGNVTKIKVTPTPAPVEPWTFAGGRITQLLETGDELKIIVEDGAHTYTLPRSRLVNDERPTGVKYAVMKYVLFDENGQHFFIASSEFKAYYEMKAPY